MSLPRRAPTTRAVVAAVPHALLGGATLLMLVLHPNAVRSALTSTRAIVVSTGLAIGWLVLAFVIAPRVLRPLTVRVAALTGLAAIGVWLLVVPTLRDTVVVERLPEGLASAPSTGPAANGVTPGATAPSPTAAQAVRVSTGALRGIDHDARGTASIIRRPDGSSVVALEDFDVEPGPDYFVHLVPGANRERPADGSQLEKLRGNQGTQFYDVPADREPGADWTVLIWCRTFGVPVANATQRAV